MELKPGESHIVNVKIPSITLLDSSDFEKLKALDYDVERGKAVDYWLNLLNKGAKIEVPDGG